MQTEISFAMIRVITTISTHSKSIDRCFWMISCSRRRKEGGFRVRVVGSDIRRRMMSKCCRISSPMLLAGVGVGIVGIGQGLMATH